MTLSFFKKSFGLFILSIVCLAVAYFNVDQSLLDTLIDVKKSRNFSVLLNPYTLIISIVAFFQLNLYFDNFEKPKAFTNLLFVVPNLLFFLKWPELINELRFQSGYKNLATIGFFMCFWILGKMLLGGKVIESDSKQEPSKPS